MSSRLTFGNPGRLLPDVPGCTSGVVAQDGAVCTVQCAVCFGTVTGKAIFATGHITFAPDDGAPRQPLAYRRCRDCRAAKRHPEAAAA